MRNVVLLGMLAFAGAIAVACGDTSNTNSLTGPGANGSGSSSSSGADASTAPSDAGAGADPDADPTAINGNSGLPCDIQKLLEDACIGCHGGNQSPRMLSYADMTAQSPQYPGQTVAQRALARLQAGTMPPAPAIPPSAQEVAAFQSWVSAGTPMGTTCTTVPDGGATDAGTTNYNTPPVCTSGQTWAGGDSAKMDPGRACLACHQVQGGPRFAVGGTVYPTAHEPNDCYGVTGGLTVVITDKNGTVFNLTVGSTGNFNSGSAGIVPPFTAKVTDGTKTRVMAEQITAGDCNSCHTETGTNGAPGRIMAP